MSEKIVLLIDSVHPVLEEELMRNGFHCILNETADWKTLANDFPQTEGIVVRSRWALNQEIMDAFHHLKWIARSGSGLENIDCQYARSKGIHVLSSPEGNADAVGEYVIGATLSMIRLLIPANASVKSQAWLREEHRGIELKNRTFGIIGLGHMGRSVAQKLGSLGCQVIAHDKYLTKSPLEHVTLVDLKTLQSKADVVSLHLPLSDETLAYADHSFFSSFEKPIYFINTARGKHCVTSDLLDAIDQHQVISATLDVLEFESTQLKVDHEQHPTYQRLLDYHNVFLTPHIAGWTSESYYKLSKVLAEKIMALNLEDR
jgi:D-3-phosphoglycerate dehydrogenase